MDQENRAHLTAGAVRILGVLAVVTPLLAFAGGVVVLDGQVSCPSRPTLPVCDHGTAHFVENLPVFGGCAGLVLGLAAVVLAIRFGRAPTAWALVAWLPPIVAMVVTGHLASPDPRGPDSTTADAVRPAAVPAGPGVQRWSWTPPAGVLVSGSVPRGVNSVVRGGAGVVVGLDDGVVALDGVTGAERWHYRSVLGHKTALSAGPDGRLVAFTISDADGERTMVLDAMTGDEVDEWPEPLGPANATTDHTVTWLNSARTVVTGRQPGGGGEWTYLTPQGCAAVDDILNPVPSDHVAAVGMTCGRRWTGAPSTTATVLVVGLDDRTGAELWRYTKQDVWSAKLAAGPGDTVLLDCDGAKIAIDPTTGTTTPTQATLSAFHPVLAPGARVEFGPRQVVGFA